MASAEAAAVFQANQDLLAAWSAPDLGIDDFRRIFEDFLGGLAIPAGAEFENVDAGGVPSIWAQAPGASADKVILHFHSGGLVMGSAKGYRSFGANLSAATGARVLLVDFRLAPEHAMPAQLDDALAAYHWVLGQGVAPSSVMICGDSGGGGLALATLLALRDRNEPLPAAGMAMSPLADWTMSGESMVTNADKDPLVPGPGLLSMLAPMVLGEGGDAKDPYNSPVFGDYTGLPPLLVMAGSIETLRDDGYRVVQAAQAVGVDATWLEGEDMVHIWPIFADRLPEARATLEEMGAFARKHLR
ncbi:MAG TPA: alpha/beta hydrolase [Sporichthya sp.]|jgi:monoterpene epsilon-lactone hydrolase|nr:alpha/beta hydrolase [Sporichthya sp.]